MGTSGAAAAGRRRARPARATGCSTRRRTDRARSDRESEQERGGPGATTDRDGCEHEAEQNLGRAHPVRHLRSRDPERPKGRGRVVRLAVGRRRERRVVGDDERKPGSRSCGDGERRCSQRTPKTGCETEWQEHDRPRLGGAREGDRRHEHPGPAVSERPHRACGEGHREHVVEVRHHSGGGRPRLQEDGAAEQRRHAEPRRVETEPDRETQSPSDRAAGELRGRAPTSGSRRGRVRSRRRARAPGRRRT